MDWKNILRRIAVVTGICLCMYPLVSSFFTKKQLSQVVRTYEKEAKKLNEEEIEQILQKAIEYNNSLFQIKNIVVSRLKEEGFSSEEYQELLDMSGTGIMGTIEIPKINVDLPIYHGTTEEVLSAGIGHLEGSSLPIGGENTHSILTGHRGLPNAQLFTRLDELEKGDLFYVQIMDYTLAYRVKEIQVIKPEDVERLSIKAGKDLVSLITCTPYGINSHRLVITGERIDYKKTEYLAIEPRISSLREALFRILPCMLVGVVVVKFVAERKRKKGGRRV